jgi:hypothetical protein
MEKWGLFSSAAYQGAEASRRRCTMTDVQKERIRGYRSQGLGYQEIANRLGLNFGAVRMHCRRSENGTFKPHALNDSLCRNCGKPVNQGKGKRKLFCCDSCRYAWHNNQRAANK